MHVDGMLSWEGRGFIGKKHKSLPVTTVDLSVDGSKLEIDPKADIALRQQCTITFANETSPAIVRDVIDKADGRKHVCIQFHQPSSEFLRVIDRWVSNKSNHRSLEQDWLNNPMA